MASFKIIGGKPLVGDIKISGSKNEALKLIPLAISLSRKVTIKNVPDILDIRSQIEIAKNLGSTVSFNNNVLDIDATGVKNGEISKKAKKLRASIVFIGPLLARFKYVECPHPGGCVIGARSIDTHTDAFRQLGAKILEEEEIISIKLDKVTSSKVILKEKSVSATENLLLYCSAVNEEITLDNIAIEPEITHLIDILNNAGAKIEFISERSIKVKGSDSLLIDEIEVIADRIEAGTFLIAYLATGGHGKILNFPSNNLKALTDVLINSGAHFKENEGVLSVSNDSSLKPFEIETSPYPGFPTDLQSPMALIAAKAEGISVIHENMFENRFGYLHELERMGLKVEFENNRTAKIFGPCTFKPTSIHSLDLRAGITLLIAALMTEGETTIHEAENIDRGYEMIEEKLRSVGATIERIDD